MPANPILVRDMLSTAHGSIGAERRDSLTQELAHMRTVAVIRRPMGAAAGLSITPRPTHSPSTSVSKLRFGMA